MEPMKIINVPQWSQQGVQDLELQFPDGWDVEVCEMKGFGCPSSGFLKSSLGLTDPHKSSG